MDEKNDVAFQDRVVGLVAQWWNDHGTAMLLSRLGTEEDGAIARDAKRQAGSLAGYLKQLDGRVRLVRPSFDPLRCGVVPADIGHVEVDNLFHQAGSTAPQFQRAFWTAFRVPLEKPKRRFISVEQPARFKDLEGNGPAGWLEVPSEYIAGTEDDKLRERSWDRGHLLSDVNIILLYVEREDSQIVLNSLGTQTLPVPLRMPCGRLDTPRQCRDFANSLVEDARRAILHGRRMLSAINEEVTNRDNKTCLLLPPKTFGKHAKNVAKLVHDAACRRDSIGEFTDGIKGMQLPRHGLYYKGDGGVVFKTPSKGGPRHGLAPSWDQEHPDSCVIAGRLRFGAPYDPRFHYDCQLPKEHRRKFPRCHTTVTVLRGRAHANVAPNDAVR